MTEDSDHFVRRNAPCPCGSGERFKRCCGILGQTTRKSDQPDIPPEVFEKIAQMRRQQEEFESEHGKIRPVITQEFHGYRLVAVGNELHWAPAQKTKFFPDFLKNYLASKLGREWGNAQLALPIEQRHQITKWYHWMAISQQGAKPEEDGTYQITPNGATLSWNRLAYDLYLIKHNAELQERVIRRLKHDDQFQGARFELVAFATLIVAGYKIAIEDESDGGRRHTEFVAYDERGLKIAVEAKSRHRNGLLGYELPGGSAQGDAPATVDVEALLRRALGKNPEMPYFIFVEVNIPYGGKNAQSSAWIKEMDETVRLLRQEWDPGDFPANAIFFCNDLSYQTPQSIPNGQTYWCYVSYVDDPKFDIPNCRNVVLQVAKAAMKRSNIPNEFPADLRNEVEEES